MAYFSNDIESNNFKEQCEKCKLKDKSCPILFVQVIFNYEASENKIATEILNNLVNENGICQMYKLINKK